METDSPAAILRRQFVAMALLSMRRLIAGRVFKTILGLAGVPVVISALLCGIFLFRFGLQFTDPLERSPHGLPVPQSMLSARGMLEVYRVIYAGAFLHFGLIFSAIAFASAAVREETDEQTLHHLYLQPIPRPLIVIGKYLGFLLVACPVFMLSMVLTFSLLITPYGFDGLRQVLATTPRLYYFGMETAVIFLAMGCYAALFLALSHFFKNNSYILFIYGWEAATNWLPPVLKNFSIAYYMKEMLPSGSKVAEDPLALIADPLHPLQSFLVLGAIIIGGLLVASWAASRKQVLYGA